MQVKNLAAAVEFALDGVAHGALVVGGDDGLDGQAVLGRGFDGAHVARAGQGQIEGARDGRGGQGQHVHGGAELLEFFLVHDAETLFLVNDHQPQILERDVALQEAVGADDDVHRAGGELADGGGQFGAGAEAGEQFDAERIIGHALAEGVEMLLGQDGGGGEDGDLFAGQGGFEGGANGHFGFAVAHVAADEAVHGAGRFHVLFGGDNGAHLVGRLLIDEAVLKFALPAGVGREGVAGLGSAGGMDGQHFGGEIPHGVFGPGFGFGPARAAEGVEAGAGLAGADVFADQMRFADRARKVWARDSPSSPARYSMTRHSSPAAGNGAGAARRGGKAWVAGPDSVRCRAGDGRRNRPPPIRRS